MHFNPSRQRCAVEINTHFIDFKPFLASKLLVVFGVINPCALVGFIALFVRSAVLTGLDDIAFLFVIANFHCGSPTRSNMLLPSCSGSFRGPFHTKHCHWDYNCRFNWRRSGRSLDTFRFSHPIHCSSGCSSLPGCFLLNPDNWRSDKTEYELNYYDCDC